MSKFIFNLKKYAKKADKTDALTDAQLEGTRSETPNEISEAQLEKGRVPESNVTIEKMLEKARTGEATTVTERQLDTTKPAFGSKMRNAAAYKGDINKLEEKRLASNPVEKEQYKPASEVAKKNRWWEDNKSPDGLKLSKSDKTVKKAQEKPLSFDKPRWEEAYWDEAEGAPERSWDELVEDEDPLDLEDDFDILEEQGESVSFEDVGYQEREIKGTPMAIGVVKVNADVNELNEEAIVRDALEFIADTKPQLKITEQNLNLSRLYSKNIISYTISLRPPVEKPPVETALASNDFPIVESSDQNDGLKKTLAFDSSVKKN